MPFSTSQINSNQVTHQASLTAAALFPNLAQAQAMFNNPFLFNPSAAVASHNNNNQNPLATMAAQQYLAAMAAAAAVNPTGGAAIDLNSLYMAQFARPSPSNPVNNPFAAVAALYSQQLFRASTLPQSEEYFQKSVNKPSSVGSSSASSTSAPNTPVGSVLKEEMSPNGKNGKENNSHSLIHSGEEDFKDKNKLSVQQTALNNQFVDALALFMKTQPSQLALNESLNGQQINNKKSTAQLSKEQKLKLKQQKVISKPVEQAIVTPQQQSQTDPFNNPLIKLIKNANENSAASLDAKLVNSKVKVNKKQAIPQIKQKRASKSNEQNVITLF